MAVGEARVPLLRGERTAHHVESPKEERAGVASSGAASGAASGAVSTAVSTSLVAGAVAGAVAKTAIAPLDRTKINFQISQTPYSWRAAVQFIARCVRREGVAALWRGNSATMARIVPYAAIQFAAHEQWKRLLGVDSPHAANQHPWRQLLAGSLAGVTSQSATYPLDVARARMAVTSAHQYSSLRAVFRRTVAEEGFRALYRGFPATVLGVIPYAGVSFFTYDTLKQKYRERFGAPQSAPVNVCLGGCAGALAQTASYPLDIVRRRMQTARRLRPQPPHSPQPPQPPQPCAYRTMRSTVCHIYTTEGWRGFFKGLSMNWVKGPIAVGISFATYDAVKGALTDLARSLRS